MGKRSREKLARRSFNEGGGEVEKRKFEFQTNWERVCIFVIRWGTYLVMFTPLIILTQFFFPFVAPKTTIFRILVEIIFAVYLFLVLSNNRYRPRINPLTIALTLFLAVFILTSFTGINLERSFWSTYERMTGIWTMLHLYAFFIVLTSVFKKREDWEKFLGVSVIVGVLLSLYVLKGSEISTRGGGTIGNTSFMAAYLLFSIFFAIILFLSNLFKKEGWSLFWQIFSGVSLLIMLPVLFASTARGAITFFTVGLFLLGFGYLWFSGKKILKRGAFAVIFLLLLLAIFAAILQPDFLTSKIDYQLSEMKSRFTVWQIGFEAWEERPLLGWGPENFNTLFGKHFNPCLFLSECGGEIWFDRVHNIVLDTLATTGLLGLLSYLAIFGVAIFGLLRILPKIVETRNLFIPLGMAVLLVVYFAQNLLVFDMINSYLVFFLSLAFVSFLISPQKEPEEIKIRKVQSIWVLAILIALLSSFWWLNVKPLKAGHYIVKAIGVQDIEAGTEYFKKSLDSLMHKYEAREYFSQKVTRSLFQQEIPAQDREKFLEAFDLAEMEMEKSVKENSLDFRPRLFLGRLYTASYHFSGDQTKLNLSQETLEKAIDLSPTNQQGYWYLGEVKLVQGKGEEAVALFKKAVDLEPRHAPSHWFLAMAYRILDQNQLAKEQVIEAEEAGFNFKNDLENLKKVIDIYLALNDDVGLVPLYLKAIELDPNDAQLWASLAASYANLGQYDKTREAAMKVLELNPDSREKIEEFLKTLPQL